MARPPQGVPPARSAGRDPRRPVRRRDVRRAVRDNRGSDAAARGAPAPKPSTLVAISAADPLNLAGIVTAGDRVPAVAATRIACLDGTPIAALEGEFLRPLADYDASRALDVTRLLSGRALPAVVSGFVGRTG